MLLEIGIGLVVGLVAGGSLAWMVAIGRTHAEKHHADQLNSDLETVRGELKTAQSSLEKSRTEGAENDARQREEIARLKAELASAEMNAEQAAKAIESLREENSRLRNELAQSQTDLVALRTRLEAEQKNALEKLELLKGARVELSNQFETLANDILEKKSKIFTEQNQTNIGNLLNPLKEKFGEFQQKVESLEKENLTGRTELKAQIAQLQQDSKQLSADANNLATALKGSSKTQGDWGEIVLERILETSGLRKGYEYRVQQSIASEDGKDARLDVILDLPGNRHVIIDSKISLNDYNDYCASQDEAVREAALKSHLASVRKHISNLSEKKYQTLYGLNSLDFVVMFVPIEPAFMLGISRDSKLWQDAWTKNILLVSPSTLLFVLRTVANLWRQETQTKKMQEVFARGRELYDKLAAFAKELTNVGEKLDEARGSYDEAVKKLSTGKGNVIRQAELLKGLGVKPTKAIPLTLVEQAREEEETLEIAAGEDQTGA